MPDWSLSPRRDDDEEPENEESEDAEDGDEDEDLDEDEEWDEEGEDSSFSGSSSSSRRGLRFQSGMLSSSRGAMPASLTARQQVVDPALRRGALWRGDVGPAPGCRVGCLTVPTRIPRSND